jgi:ubiquinone/menaquinone biosynthesis C-methylase UbiE
VELTGTKLDSTLLANLSRERVSEQCACLNILRGAATESVALYAGVNRHEKARVGRVIDVTSEKVILNIENLEMPTPAQLFFSFCVNRGDFLLVATDPERIDQTLVMISGPIALYRAERRGEIRNRAASVEKLRWKGLIVTDTGQRISALVTDISPQGVGVELRLADVQALDESASIRFERICDQTGIRYARVRNRSVAKRGSGWTRLGMSLADIETGVLLAVEHLENRSSTAMLSRLRGRGRAEWLSQRTDAEASLRWRESQDEPRIAIHEILNRNGQKISAIVDRCPGAAEPIFVIIPPAWGRTKESLLFLATTIIEGFSRANLAACVVRFDGTNRRGESYIDEECRRTGDEYLHFTFSQAVADIESIIAAVRAGTWGRPRKIVLVTASLAAIEGRRVTARNVGKSIDGWISLVGVTDLQSSLRALSGGIDYGSGLRRGLRFGRAEIVGVVADMDRTGLDAIENGMGFLDDARRDMARIDVPVTWLHGRFDAWTNIDRVREIMSYGRTDNRKLIEMDTGHHLRRSLEALRIFEVVAREAAAIGSRENLPDFTISLAEVDRRAEAERQRLPSIKENLREFWKDYLLGRDRTIGFDLFACTSAYRRFLACEVDLMQLAAHDVVIDLGCGTNRLATYLEETNNLEKLDKLIAIDFVHEVLKEHEHSRAIRRSGRGQRGVVADLDVASTRWLPLRDEAADVVFASLLLTYVGDPDALLGEAFRVLRRGGRLVVSGAKRDADVSKLYIEGLAELKDPARLARFPKYVRDNFESLAGSFLNDASRLLNYEESGVFNFLEAEELMRLLMRRGFRNISVRENLGEPTQAIIAAGMK